jgi:hypothetical protein
MGALKNAPSRRRRPNALLQRRSRRRSGRPEGAADLTETFITSIAAIAHAARTPPLLRTSSQKFPAATELIRWAQELNQSRVRQPPWVRQLATTPLITVKGALERMMPQMNGKDAPTGNAHENAGRPRERTAVTEYPAARKLGGCTLVRFQCG